MLILRTILWFLALLGGAEILVRGASDIARRFRLDETVIGLTLVAFGTSLPELVTAVFAIADDTGSIALGNILWSNLANILLVLGAVTLITTVSVKNRIVRQEVPLALAISGVFALLVFGAQSKNFWLDFFDGGILLLGFLGYFRFLFTTTERSDDFEKPSRSLRKSILAIAGGVGGLVLGGELLTSSAVEFSQILGVSQWFIGATLIAVGTSLPELATSLIAAHKNRLDMAVGNILGSNLFNTLFVLGIGLFVGNIAIDEFALRGSGLNILAHLVLVVAIFLRPRKKLTRRNGLIFLALYLGALALLNF